MRVALYSLKNLVSNFKNNIDFFGSSDACIEEKQRMEKIIYLIDFLTRGIGRLILAST